MQEIFNFKIHKAEAEKNTEGGFTFRLFYPRKLEVFNNRIEENLDFGIGVLRSLIEKGYSEIATLKNPIKPSNSGLVYLLKDEYLVIHRRDKKAPTHKLYHSIPAGFTQSKEATHTLEGLIETGLKESAEECLLITRKKKPKLIVPRHSKNFILETAQNLKLKLEPKYVNTESFEFNDRLEVYDHKNNLLFFAKGLIDLFYESQTSINLLQVKKIPLSSNEIYPIDAEGFFQDGKFIHFNRESYLLNLKEISGKVFGDVLTDPLVFKTKISNGIPKVYKPTYKKPYLGPNKIETVFPHLWAPDNLLTRVLDGLSVEGYKGRWMQMELEKEIKKKNKEPLI